MHSIARKLPTLLPPNFWRYASSRSSQYIVQHTFKNYTRSFLYSTSCSANHAEHHHHHHRHECCHNYIEPSEFQEEKQEQNLIGGGVGIGKVDGDMAIVFTCNKCETRAIKQFTKQSYYTGLVIVQCPGCKSLHLVADNLGWFNNNHVPTEIEPHNVEQYLKLKGEMVKKISSDYQLSPEEWQDIQQLLQKQTSKTVTTAESHISLSITEEK